MARVKQKSRQLFDAWPDEYDRWFESALGSIVRQCEEELVSELLSLLPGETILDAGCGTGVFTGAVLASGSRVVGIDASLPMLQKASSKLRSLPFTPLAADILNLPFKDETFDKTVSITALEFLAEADAAIAELFRVTRSRGVVLAATLNSLSPWATRRTQEAAAGNTIFSSAVFRSPAELLALAPVPGIAKTAVHFEKDADPAQALAIERSGREKGLETGAFVAARWQKP